MWVVFLAANGGNALSVENQGKAYSNNIIQSILDAAYVVAQQVEAYHNITPPFLIFINIDILSRMTAFSYCQLINWNIERLYFGENVC